MDLGNFEKNMTTWKKVSYLKDNIKASPEHTFYHHELILPEPLASWDVFDYWEKERIFSMRDNLTKDDILFDIGTEHGWMSVVLAKFTKVFLIEPTKEFWPNIKETWFKNASGNPIGCYSGLIGKTTNDKTKDFGWPKESDGELIGANKYEYLNNHSKDIKIMKLDDLVKRSGVIPTALNIDVEGSEYEVILGAKKTIKKYKPKIWISVHPDLMEKEYNYKPELLFLLLNELGYSTELLGVDHEMHYYFEYEN